MALNEAILYVFALLIKTDFLLGANKVAFTLFQGYKVGHLNK